MNEIGTGIYRYKGSLYTENADPGEDVYGERLLSIDGKEYREWSPDRSKACAALEKDVDLGLSKNDNVLYLGAASGTTVSHFSDILVDGFIFAVEYSEETGRKLVELAEKRDNIAPIIGDARKPAEYGDLVGDIDVVYQDISQRDQAEILERNVERFLSEGGTVLVAVKARSISSVREPKEVFEEFKDDIEESFVILDETRLEPYEKDHLFLKLEEK